MCYVFSDGSLAAAVTALHTNALGGGLLFMGATDGSVTMWVCIHCNVVHTSVRMNVCVHVCVLVQTGGMRHTHIT